MSYRAFRSPAVQTLAETQQPERFSDGSAWSELALRALDLGAQVAYDPAEWAGLTGTSPLAERGQITASGLWRLRPDYEAERLRALWVTLEGINHLGAQRDELALRLREASGTAAIQGLRAASAILTQALTDPDRRAPWGRLARELDIQGATLYQPGEQPARPALAGTPARRPKPVYDQALLAEIRLGGLRYSVEQIRGFARAGRIPPEFANYTRAIAGPGVRVA